MDVTSQGGDESFARLLSQIKALKIAAALNKLLPTKEWSSDPTLLKIACAAFGFFNSSDEPLHATTTRAASYASIAATRRHDQSPLMWTASRGDETTVVDMMHPDVSDAETERARDVARDHSATPSRPAEQVRAAS